MHWRWKLRLLNLSAMIYFVALSTGSLVIALLITLPEVYRDSPETLQNRRLAAVHVFLVTLLNYACLRHYSAHSRVRADWIPRILAEAEEVRVCRSCNLPTPPRARHCPLCDACVLKRDHHCFFRGCSVGFHNQRYFLMFCLYGSLGSLYSSYVTFAYLGSHYASVVSWEWYAFLLPWLLWYWFIGQTIATVVAMVIFSYFCVFTFLACSYFCAFQGFLLMRGQTSYEYVKGIRRYGCSLGESLRSVFGPLWLVNVVVPLPCLKSAHNGVDWKVVHDFKQM
ncbi:hypothetical protein ACOMHN_047268 [Nucella lapillus]